MKLLILIEVRKDNLPRIVLGTLLGTCRHGRGMLVQESEKVVKPALLTRSEIE
jgi:hypothetical protein